MRTSGYYATACIKQGLHSTLGCFKLNEVVDHSTGVIMLFHHSMHVLKLQCHCNDSGWMKNQATDRDDGAQLTTGTAVRLVTNSAVSECY